MSRTKFDTTTFIESVSNRFAKWSTKKFLLTLIVLQILLHIPILPLPPMGQHTWRQVMGLAPARNYFEEDSKFLYPSQDVRIAQADKGVTYFEFPLLYWIIGQSYHLTGFSHINGRFMMLVVGVLLILGSYRLIRSLGFNEIKARWFTLFVSTSPYFFYYSVTVSPNLPALTWFIWGTALLIPSISAETWGWKFWLGIILILLGTISKATYLFFGLPIAYLFISQFFLNRNPKVLVTAVISFLVITLPNLFLYIHSKRLFDESPIERQAHTVLKSYFYISSWSDITTTLRPAIVEWFLQMFVNTAAIPFFMVGCYLVLRNKKWRSRTGKFFLMWLISFFVFSFFFFTQFRQHAYYLTPLLVFAAAGSAQGMDFLWKKNKFRLLLFVLIICVPLVMVGRVGHRWLWSKQVPDELLYRAEEFEKVIPENERVLVFDSSPFIYLYYLHRKGVTASPSISQKTLEQYQENGFKYIVSEYSLSKIPALQKKRIKTVAKIGDFGVFLLEKRKL